MYDIWAGTFAYGMYFLWNISPNCELSGLFCFYSPRHDDRSQLSSTDDRRQFIAARRAGSSVRADIYVRTGLRCSRSPLCWLGVARIVDVVYTQ